MANTRKIDRAATETVCPAFRDEHGVWHVRDLAGGRALLRDTETVQAGLGVETVEKAAAELPPPGAVLGRAGAPRVPQADGPFFTPRRVDEEGRVAILHEVARLEPPLAALKRRTTAPVTLPDGTVIAADERVDVSIAAANLDQAAAPGLTFGDGPHKCPGSYLAVQEADIFLTKLFALDGVCLTASPRVAFNDAFGSYSLHDMVVSVGDRTVEA